MQGGSAGAFDPPQGRAAIATVHSGGASLTPGLAAWADWIVQSLRRDFEFPYCAVLVPTADGRDLRPVEQRSGHGDAPGDEPLSAGLVPIDRSVCGAVLPAGTPMLIADVRQVDGYAPIPGRRMRSELAVPILVDGRAVGVINVESPRVGAFDIGDLHRVVARAAEAATIAPEDLRRG